LKKICQKVGYLGYGIDTSICRQTSNSVRRNAGDEIDYGTDGDFRGDSGFAPTPKQQK
jgi:hypothetical protein